MDQAAAQKFIDEVWMDEIVPEITEYIKIPNKSPHFDPDWEEHGYMEQAVTQFEDWCRKQPIKGMQVEVVRLEGRTPLLFIDIPGDSDDVVLLYGHTVRQGWSFVHLIMHYGFYYWALFVFIRYNWLALDNRFKKPA